jgi:hypothetical protein
MDERGGRQQRQEYLTYSREAWWETVGGTRRRRRTDENTGCSYDGPTYRLTVVRATGGIPTVLT